MSLSDFKGDVWLARDDFHGARYEIYRKEPSSEYGSYSGDLIEHMWPDDFEEATGYKLSPGECRRVRIKIEEVK